MLYVPYTVWNLAATADDQIAAAAKIAIAKDRIYYPGDTATFTSGPCLVPVTAPSPIKAFDARATASVSRWLRVRPTARAPGKSLANCSKQALWLPLNP